MDEPYVFSAAGTYTFTVTETAGENIEITYDDTTYTVVIEVVDNPEEGKLEIASATIDGEDVTESDGLVFTNVFSPRLKDVTIKKIWEQGNLLDLPAFITVEILANGVPERTVTIFPGEDNSWTQAIGDLYWYDEDGNEIEYTIREESIDGTKEGTFIAYEGDAILGQWTNEVKDYEITNTWTEATNEYEYDGEGKTKFTIKKEDENGNALAGVKFKVNGKKYTTDANGKIMIEVPVEADENEDELTFTVKEVETLEGYEKVEGEAEITVTCTFKLEVDEETLTNKYVKTCTFGKSGSEKFKWDETKLRLTVVNNKISEEEPVDPCADGGGCGGEVEPEPKPVLPVVTPDTGRLVRTSGGAAQDMTANFIIGRCILFAAGLMLLFSTSKRKNAGLTK